jgi:hypothetical protein
LSPGREDYVVVAARLLAQKQDFARARAMLDLLLRSAGDATVRAEAQQLLASVADFERRKAALEANLADRASSTSAQPGAASRSFSAPRVVPTLRTMEPGESRMFGKLTAVECSGEAITLVVRTLEGVGLRAHARKFKEVALVSFRDDLRGAVQCGPRNPADPVLLTFRPDANSTSEGTAVAVEFVPLDYTP